ncbi:hypothetical protein [Parendozoicomonas haliclonae]|uniref:BppU N-terminal domain-containing protein n=1 Tax=Parendozoicomonas haliclonae TaxID=1960125 RepID=A0A1X7AEI1_9GAMM|nr:hypothetical protein [Parendozoicomonas haliclonae]SMA33297.1 hypothetical protein EHSB41UT_00255 [Parendozoicomonas haliclonae]
MSNTLKPFYRGDTRPYTVSLRDEADTPIDISGWVLSCTMKLSTEQPDSEAPVRVSNTISSADGVAGVAPVVLPKEQTQNLLATVYQIDFQLESPEGAVTTLFAGEVEVLADVTRGTE